jgi:hypothetical protein
MIMIFVLTPSEAFATRYHVDIVHAQRIQLTLELFIFTVTEGLFDC